MANRLATWWMVTVALIPAAWMVDAASQPVPELYDECSFDSIQDLMGNFIADQKEVVGSCSDAHAAPAGTLTAGHKNLPPEVIAKLDAKGGFGWGIFNATILNRSHGYTVTAVTIAFTPSGKGVTPEMASKVIQHHIGVTINPHGKATVSIPLETGIEQEYLWKISGAEGYSTPPAKQKAGTR